MAWHDGGRVRAKFRSLSPCPRLLHRYISIHLPRSNTIRSQWPPRLPMGKIGFQKGIYCRFIPLSQSWPSQHMERFLLRPQSPASSSPADPPDPADLPLTTEGTPQGNPMLQQTQLSESTVMVTVAVLDLKLQTLLQDLTHNIAKEVGKIAKELRGEIDQLGECTDTLENKFDELVQYVHVLEEDNATIKHTVSQLQLQQKDLENRQRHQNLRICGVPESISDKELHLTLFEQLTLFVTLAPISRIYSRLAP